MKYCTIKISAWWYGGKGIEDNEVNLFDGCAPKLRELSLTGIKVPPSTPFLLQVRKLHLHEPLLTPSQCLDIVGANPHLTDLLIGGLLDPPTADWQPKAPVHNERIKRLVLLGNTGPHILPHLHIPGCGSSRVVSDLPYTSTAQSRSSARDMARHLVRHIASLPPSSLKVTWRIDGGRAWDAVAVHWTGTLTAPDSYELELGVPTNSETGAAWMEVMVACLEHVTQQATVGLQVHWITPGQEEPMQPKLLQILLGIPATSLTFHCRISPLLALACCSRLADGSWPFPNLETLALCNHGYGPGLATLADLLERRYSLEADGSGAPMLLKNVRLPNGWDDDAEMTREIVRIVLAVEVMVTFGDQEACECPYW